MNHDTLTNEIILDLLEEERFKSEATKIIVVDAPPKFDPINWVRWHLLLCNYMRSLVEFTQISFYNVICEENRPEKIEIMDKTDTLIYHAIRHGNVFNEDNKRVYRILKQLLASINV